MNCFNCLNMFNYAWFKAYVLIFKIFINRCNHYESTNKLKPTETSKNCNVNVGNVVRVCKTASTTSLFS